MRIEFEKLEQRPGTHTVPVKMSREDLEETAQKMSDLTTRIEAKEGELRDFQKEMREEIKELDDKRSAAARIYRMKREPSTVSGLWGFDQNDHGKVKCKLCYDADQKIDKAHGSDGGGVSSYETEKALVKAHKKGDGIVGEPHDVVPQWERPLGTKWFVIPEQGDVFGPVAITERDLQKVLPIPATTEVAPFAIAFDADTAVPLLNEEEHSKAQKKLKETEKEEGPDFAAAREIAAAEGLTDLHPECGLPSAWHPEKTEDNDPCKEAMLRAADEENKAQAARTDAKYGADEVLEPDTTYPCGECGTSTFGKDLQPVIVQTDDGAVRKHVCFSCEQKVPKAAPDAKPRKKTTRKKKDKK